jgi:hypothetical protein
MSSQLQASAALAPGKALSVSTGQDRGWAMCPRSGLDAVEKMEIPCTSQKSNPGS